MKPCTLLTLAVCADGHLSVAQAETAKGRAEVLCIRCGCVLLFGTVHLLGGCPKQIVQINLCLNRTTPTLTLSGQFDPPASKRTSATECRMRSATF
jgi:hypothetical protein